MSNTGPGAHAVAAVSADDAVDVAPDGGNGGDGRRSARVGNAVVLAVAAVATLGLLPWLDKPVYRDEGASLYSAHLGWSGLWQQSRVVDLVLLPYYAFLHLWIQVSDSIQWVRLPSLLAFGATVFLVGRLGLRFAGPGCGVLSAIVVATNPLMVQAALYARPYALSVLTATAASIALLRWLGGGGVRWMWWFCVASVATVLLQVFAVLAPLSVLVVALGLRHGTVRREWRSLVAPLGVLLAGVLAVVGFGATQRGQIAWIPPFHGRQLVKAVLGPTYGGSGTYSAVLVVVVVVALILCLRARRLGTLRTARTDLELLAVSVAWAVVPTLVLVAVSLVRPVYVDRYVTASVPGLAVAVALLVARGFGATTVSWAARTRAVVGVAALVVVLAVIIPRGTMVAAEYVPENLQQAAQFLVVHVGPGGRAALPDHSITTGVEYYLGGAHPSVATWPQLAVQPYIEGLDLAQGGQALAHAPDDVWLVDDGSVAGTRAFVTVLTRAGYAPAGTTRLPGVDIRHFHRSAGS